uniref:Uncharacterized protein n=1 Tax=Oryza meridionalis TaxID=40149 RepID=A0A0E0DCM6_9ORYZ
MAMDEMVGGSADHWLHEKTTAAVGSTGRWRRIVAPREGSGTAGSTMTKRHRVAGNAHCLLCEKTAAPVGSEDSWGGGGEDFGMGIGDLRVAWVGKWGMGERIFRSHNVLMDGRMEPRWRDRTVHAYAGTVTLQQRIAALWFTGSGL